MPDITGTRHPDFKIENYDTNQLLTKGHTNMNKRTILLIFILMAMGVHYASGQSPTVFIGDYQADPGTVNIPIEVSGFTDPIGAVTLYIEYDDDALAFLSHTDGLIANSLSNATASANGYTVAISWVNELGTDISAGGTLLTLNFDYAGGSSIFDFLFGCEFSSTVEVIPVQYNNGSISPDPNSITIDIVDQLNIDPTESGYPGYLDVVVESNFSEVPNGGVGAFNFEIEYDNTIISSVALLSTHPSLASLSLNVVTGPPRIAVAWYSTTPSSLNGAMFTVRLGYSGGNTELAFLPGAVISDAEGNTLNAFYNNGIITQDPATLPHIIIGEKNAVAGTVVEVPVTTLNFETYVPDVGALDLAINFNSSLLQFVELTNINPKLSGLIQNALTNYLGISWSNPALGTTFADGEKLFDIQFNYSGTNLPVVFDETACEIADANTGYSVRGLYIDGAIIETPSNLTVCMEEVAGTLGAQVVMPIRVTDFTNIGAITLTIDFEPLQLGYIQLQSENSQLTDNGSSLFNYADGSFYYSWTANTEPSTQFGITIPDDEVLFELKFNFTNGPAPLTFDVAHCDIADYDINSLGTTYCDGLVKSVIDVQIKTFLQGLYNTGSSQMNKAQDFVGGALVDKFQGTVADLITIELHDAATYATIIRTISDVELNQNGTALFQLPATFNGSYYVTIKNRNHLETVSALSIDFSSGNVVYDFTTAATQAYGSNMKELESGVFGIYAGEVYQDGQVNFFDISLVIDALRSANNQGYLLTDLNGDGSINFFDLSIATDNQRLGVLSQTP